MGRDRISQIKIRTNQDFFRKSLLAAYGSACCITGINIPALLIASHIKPWQVSNPKNERLSPTNGLLLNSFHDKAFDRGYMTIDNRYVIRISRHLSDYESNEMIKDWLISLNGNAIRLPEKFLPGKEFIEYHNDMVFIR